MKLVHKDLRALGVDHESVKKFLKYKEADAKVADDSYMSSTAEKANKTRAFRVLYKDLETKTKNASAALHALHSIHDYKGKDAMYEDMLSFKSFLETNKSICETADAGLAAKAEKSGISIGTLRKVYNRGMAAWNSGHRPGTTPQQWGMARVNSYITKGKGTYHGADKDLREEELDEAVPKDKESGLPKKYVAGLSPSTAKARAAHWEKMDKKSDSDPSAYEPAPGDATAKTKESKHTKKYREMFGEEITEEVFEACWDGYKQVGMKKKGTEMVPDCVEEDEDDIPSEEYLNEAEYQGKEVSLGKPFRTPDGPKKFAVYVKNSSGKVVIVRFGDPNMEIKRDDPERRKNFRARHNCDSATDKTTPRYWSCYQWRAGAKVES